LKASFMVDGGGGDNTQQSSDNPQQLELFFVWTLWFRRWWWRWWCRLLDSTDGFSKWSNLCDFCAKTNEHL
jgi:hypothetical protein